MLVDASDVLTGQQLVPQGQLGTRVGVGTIRTMVSPLEVTVLFFTVSPLKTRANKIIQNGVSLPSVPSSGIYSRVKSRL